MILHVDLDAFYASVERGRRPEIRGPLIVGWPGPRGVVLSCSYEARAAGVRNGMPGTRARRLCPDATFVPPDFAPYREASRGFRAILDAVTPLVEPISLDEAFCDVSGTVRVLGAGPDIAAAIRRRVRDELGLTCSVGCGPNKLVAKLASRAAKPDGIVVVSDVAGFLRPLAVRDLWGVGAATAARLASIGVRTAGQLADAPPALVRRTVGEAAGAHLCELANGIDPSPVTPDIEARSVGAEETFPEDIAEQDRLHAEILRLSDRAASRLIASGLRGRTVTVKIRLAGFETHTRSRTLDAPTDDLFTINAAARELFDAFARRRAVRLLGVTLSNLTSGPVAQQLAFGAGRGRTQASRAMAAVRDRFGPEAVRLARLLPDD